VSVKQEIKHNNKTKQEAAPTTLILTARDCSQLKPYIHTGSSFQDERPQVLNQLLSVRM